MWTDSEREWLERNREIIDSGDLEKLRPFLPLGNSRDKILIILTLLMDKEFKVLVTDIRPKHKLTKILIYTTLLEGTSTGSLTGLGVLEWIYKNDVPDRNDVEDCITKVFSHLGIPKNMIEESLSKTVYTVGR